jgi:hypothetical protein
MLRLILAMLLIAASATTSEAARPAGRQSFSLSYSSSTTWNHGTNSYGRSWSYSNGYGKVWGHGTNSYGRSWSHSSGYIYSRGSSRGYRR